MRQKIRQVLEELKKPKSYWTKEGKSIEPDIDHATDAIMEIVEESGREFIKSDYFHRWHGDIDDRKDVMEMGVFGFVGWLKNVGGKR